MGTLTSVWTTGAVTAVTATLRVDESVVAGWAARVVAADWTAAAAAAAAAAPPPPPESGIVAMTSRLTEAALTRSVRMQSGA